MRNHYNLLKYTFVVISHDFPYFIIVIFMCLFGHLRNHQKSHLCSNCGVWILFSKPQMGCLMDLMIVVMCWLPVALCDAVDGVNWPVLLYVV